MIEFDVHQLKVPLIIGISQQTDQQRTVGNLFKAGTMPVQIPDRFVDVPFSRSRSGNLPSERDS